MVFSLSRIDHELINLPVKGRIGHKKHSPFIRIFDPNKQEVFIGLKKKVYSLFKPSADL